MVGSDDFGPNVVDDNEKTIALPGDKRVATKSETGRG